MTRDSRSAFWRSRASFPRTPIGEQLSSSGAPSTFVGQILDADTLLLPGDPNTTFATPAALPSNPNAYDLESIVTHELGHSFGFNHSGVWGAMMFPFAPPPGQITGTRPTAQSPDAPLSDDDRTGLRVLYPDPSDSVHIGAISGHVLPANPLALPISPAGVTGIFPAQVVALDNATGTVTAAVMAGWSCGDPGPAQFDGTFSLQRLLVGTSQSYRDLCGAARRAGGPGKRHLQFDVAVPEFDDRSWLARAIRVRGAGVRGALFRADSAGALRNSTPCAFFSEAGDVKWCRPSLWGSTTAQCRPRAEALAMGPKTFAAQWSPGRHSWLREAFTRAYSAVVLSHWMR